MIHRPGIRTQSGCMDNRHGRCIKRAVPFEIQTVASQFPSALDQLFEAAFRPPSFRRCNQAMFEPRQRDRGSFHRPFVETHHDNLYGSQSATLDRVYESRNALGTLFELDENTPLGRHGVQHFFDRRNPCTLPLARLP